MRKIKLLLTTAALWVVLCVTAQAAPLEGYTNIYAVYEKDGLTITSFSASWTDKKTEALYEELLQNHHSAELSYLQHIYLYPDSPIEAAGSYYDDIRISRNGTFQLGSEAYIELYNMDNVPTVADIATTLSHEYGHHYTLYNISRYESLLYINWHHSEYAALRSLSAYDISYDTRDEAYEYINDVTEIAANDYVQLFGSPTARKSYDYLDSEEVVALNKNVSMPLRAYNCIPQQNTSLPLAADIQGLYAYFLKIAGESPQPGQSPVITKRPVILDIAKEPSFKYPRYTLTLSEAEGNGPFEYTVIMYREAEPLQPIPIKTMRDGEPLKAVFGSVYRTDPDGSIYGIFDSYTGKYLFKVFAKDRNGFIYSSQAYAIDFGR